MQNHGKIQRLIILIILNIIVLVLVVVLSNFTYAQYLHNQTLYEITKYTPSKQNAHITVGNGPSAIIDAHSTAYYFPDRIYVANKNDSTVSIDSTNNTKIGKDILVGKSPSAIDSDNSLRIYVANSDDNTVSVIDATNNTKIKDIPVGFWPSAIGFDYLTNAIYVANLVDGTVSVIDETNNTKIKDIPVGNRPSAIGVVHIGVDVDISRIYVANKDDNTVSVIDPTNNTKIKDIPVGNSPSAIGVDDRTKTIYVANSDDNTVSVIDATNNTKIKDIPVGNSPSAIGVDESTKTIYVANKDDNTVSVIDPTNNTKIKDIPVGNSPSAIGVDDRTKTIYVANSDDNTVSVIDSEVNKVVARVMFNIEPFNAGHIECDKDKLIAPIAEQFYIYPGSECTAKPDRGFEFVSWQENLNGNSTRLLSLVPPASTFEPILDFLHMNQDKPEAKLNITKFGSFTANFKALPPPIPPEYVATLFAVVATAFIGSWLTPTVIGWRNARKQGSKLDYYNNEIKKVYDEARIDRNDILELDSLRNNIKDEYTRGKINKESHDKLVHEISISYGEIFTKEIHSLNNLSESDKVKRLSTTIEDIEDMYAKGGIDNAYYTNLKKQTSILYQEIFGKRIDSLNSLPENDKGKLLDEIKEDISDAYSKENISELHYTLLEKKLSNYERQK